MSKLGLKQRVYRLFFWLLLSYIAVSTTWVLVKQTSGLPEDYLKKQAFAKQFARAYYRKGLESPEVREDRLNKDFFAGQLAKEDEVLNQYRNSYVRNVDVIKMEEGTDGDEVTAAVETVQTTAANKPEVNNYWVKFTLKPNGTWYNVSELPVYIDDLKGEADEQGTEVAAS
ncbi:MAG: hypothetical protein RLZ12_359 [Bacillota bacterium]|jgi:hypothetical protein